MVVGIWLAERDDRIIGAPCDGITRPCCASEAVRPRLVILILRIRYVVSSVTWNTGNVRSASTIPNMALKTIYLSKEKSFCATNGTF